MAAKVRFAVGSSPLTRGKPGIAVRGELFARLIPAHAGKTAADLVVADESAAHPRSRGENIRTALGEFASDGSSPLTRGKQPCRCLSPYNIRLIPAHAGKTEAVGEGEGVHWAHPRSRGENSRG